jgi:hypothetical protein
MKTTVQTFMIVGLCAVIGSAAFAAPKSIENATAATSCAWQVVAAQRDTVWTNILEGGPIKAVQAAATHSKPYRNFVCAKPGVDWSSFGHIEVEAITVSQANDEKPLTARQAEQLKTALERSLSKQFRAAEKGERTLKIRATIMDVRRTKAILNVVTLAAIQAPVSFGSATAHFELIDASAGMKIGDVLVRGSGRTYEIIPSVTSLGDSKKVLGRASRQLGKDINLLRDRFGPLQVAMNTTAQ